MLEKFKFSWRLTAHRHPSGGLKNLSPHARPLNSLLSLLNNCFTPSMGLNNFLDDQEDGYENVWECLDFPPKPDSESGQDEAPALTFWFCSFHSVYETECWLFFIWPKIIDPQWCQNHAYALSEASAYDFNCASKSSKYCNNMDRLRGHATYPDGIGCFGPVDLDFFSRLLSQHHIPIE